MKNKKKYEVKSFDDLLDEQLGKKGTKKRAKNDKKMKQIQRLLHIRELINEALNNV
jgi:hypothetical protein